jgi:DNA repair exonuclease SbcCD ATPase subunit
MRVVRLQAENFKKLKAVDITPDGNVVQITGANEQGKTSVIDAIWAALQNADMGKATGTVRPIRDGEKKAVVTLDLGDMIVTRKWNESGSTVTVESKDGARFSSPQAVLDGLVGRVAIDPLSFASMDEKKQRELLLKMVNFPIDLEKTKQYRNGAFEKRTDINRNIKLLESQLVGLPEVPAETPDKEENAGIIISQMEDVGKVLNANDNRRNDLKNAEKDISFLTTDIVNANSEIERIRKSIEDFESKLNAAMAMRDLIKTEVDALVDPDLEPFKHRLTEIETINKNVRVKIQVKKTCDQIESLRKEAQAYTDKITAIDKEKEDALDKCKFPIDGLGFSDDGILYKGIPFSQCSSGERLRVSVAIAIAMNPKLRVIRITDGSLIDKKNMAAIEKMCADNDWQAWVERVDESGAVGIMIEDGSVVSKK